MKKILFTFILGLLISVTSIEAQWTQIGGDIDGRSVSISADGSVIAVGIPGNDDNGTNAGQVRIYKNINGTWTQVGQNINGEAEGDGSGTSVSLSSDGSIVAIGAPNNDGAGGPNSGHVRVYQNIDNVWTQIGDDIDGKYSWSASGDSVSLSSDGSIVAIGAPYDDVNAIASGRVYVYKNNSGSWVQVGNDIEGYVKDGYFGNSVSISSDGSIVAIGAPYDDGGYNNEEDEYNIDFGVVYVYKNNSGTWTQMGDDIYGYVAQGLFGSSVSLNSDGNIIAIGASGSGIGGTNPGKVRIYEYISGNWRLKANIDGDEEGELFGASVSLNSDGSIVAIGAINASTDANYSGGAPDGRVSIYKNNSGVWTQVGADIEGQEGDGFGYSVSLNSDGSIVASGPKHIRVYKNNALNISELKEAGISIYPNPSTGVFNIKNAKNYEITITDITGKVIYHHTAATVNEQIYLQQSGVYIINFKSQTKNFSSKIIVK